jgi:2-iminobutanoate/2-iminopropanoate deaminase
VSAQFFAPGEGGTPPVKAPLSAAARAGNLVWTAGQLAYDENGDLVGEGDVAAQTEQTLRNVDAALRVAGAAMADVVKVTVWLTDTANFAVMNEVYRRWFDEPRPVRACVRADLMGQDLLVEIEATAVVD